MNNIVLNSELDIMVLSQMTYAQLDQYTNDLEASIKELEEMKKNAVLCLMDKKVEEFKSYMNYARINREAMLVVMMAKEHDTCEFLNIETIWLN